MYWGSHHHLEEPVVPLMPLSFQVLTCRLIKPHSWPGEYLALLLFHSAQFVSILFFHRLVHLLIIAPHREHFKLR